MRTVKIGKRDYLMGKITIAVVQEAGKEFVNEDKTLTEVFEWFNLTMAKDIITEEAVLIASGIVWHSSPHVNKSFKDIEEFRQTLTGLAVHEYMRFVVDFTTLFKRDVERVYMQVLDVGEHKKKVRLGKLATATWVSIIWMSCWAMQPSILAWMQ